ncbi:MAG: AMP-binding protein [Acidimicrobiia bacterium]|nr:AMP-binding protein [Acidimicrobiia bacterium]
MGAVTSQEIAEIVKGRTVPRLFRDTVAAHGDRMALRWKDGDDWAEWTWSEYARRAATLAAALGELGVKHGDRVMLMIRNRPEFHVADMAVLLAGATPISIYNSSSPEQIRYLIGHCGGSVAIVEDVDFLERVLKVRGELPTLRHVAVMDDPDDRAPEDVHRWDTLLSASPVDLDSAAEIAATDDLATVIYTSGTTGPPKGVMLDHENIAWTIESLERAMPLERFDGRRLVSYLPMAHIAERMVTHYMGVQLGYEVTTCPEPGQIASYLGSSHPEIFFGVPRVWEKIQAGVNAVVGADPDKAAAFEQARAVGLKAALARAAGEEVPDEIADAYEQAEGTALRLVRELLGLDHVVAGITAAAPITRETLEFFLGIGVPISELYGMSESTGPMTWESRRVKPGTVGRAIPGCDVRLADDGEVICRGGNVFRGYLNDPEKTAETIDDDGWLHSGDIGVIDDDGYFSIVDRKKELIITAGGKDISPPTWRRPSSRSTSSVRRARSVTVGRS